jgi:LCP family protein required for cell wall assembly
MRRIGRHPVGLAVGTLAIVASVVIVIVMLGAGAHDPDTGTVASRMSFGRAHADALPALDGSTPIFILLVGSDSRDNDPIEQGRADSIHILGINPVARRATLLGIPRDSWVPLATGGTDKINAAMPAGGVNAEVQTVENLTGIHLDYYAVTAFQGFTHAVDEIGGLSIDLPYAVVGDGGGSWGSGPQHMTGADALGYARSRDHLPRGDFDRSWDQGFVMLSALDQFSAEMQADPAAVYRWLGAGLRHVDTSLSVGELLQLAGSARSVPTSRITNLVALGTGGWEGTKSVVRLSSANAALFDDLGQDGYILPGDIPAGGVATLAR